MGTTPNLVTAGDVISLSEEECHIFENASPGEYVVEEAKERGGWYVIARKLNPDGCFSRTNPIICFNQCPGYYNSLVSPFVIPNRRMTRVFV